MHNSINNLILIKKEIQEINPICQLIVVTKTFGIDRIEPIIKIGNAADLRIYHDGSNSRIEDTGTGRLFISSDLTQFLNAAKDETTAEFIEGGACQLYYANSKKFETTAYGGMITDNDASAELRFTSSVGRVGSVWGNSDTTFGLLDGQGHYLAAGTKDAEFSLYYDNAVKLATTNDGTVITGICTATSFSGSGANLTNLPAAGLSTEALITSGITTVLDLSNAQDHKITASGICTITTAGGTEGESHTIRITNSGIATVGFSSYFQFAGGASPVLTKTNGAVNLVSFTVNKTATTTGITTELLTSVANNFS